MPKELLGSIFMSGEQSSQRLPAGAKGNSFRIDLRESLRPDSH